MHFRRFSIERLTTMTSLKRWSPSTTRTGLLAPCLHIWMKTIVLPSRQYWRFFYWGLLQIFHIWDFSHTKRIKYSPRHLFKRSKKLISAKHLLNISTLFILLKEKIRNTSQVDKRWSGGKIDLHPTAPTEVLSFVGWSGTRSALSEEGFNSLKGCELKNKYPPSITWFINKSRSNVQNEQNPWSRGSLCFAARFVWMKVNTRFIPNAFQTLRFFCSG